MTDSIEITGFGKTGCPANGTMNFGGPEITGDAIAQTAREFIQTLPTFLQPGFTAREIIRHNMTETAKAVEDALRTE